MSVVALGSCTSCFTPVTAAATSYAYISRTHPRRSFATSSASIAAAMRSYSSIKRTRSERFIITGAGPERMTSSTLTESLFSSGMSFRITSGMKRDRGRVRRRRGHRASPHVIRLYEQIVLRAAAAVGRAQPFFYRVRTIRDGEFAPHVARRVQRVHPGGLKGTGLKGTDAIERSLKANRGGRRAVDHGESSTPYGSYRDQSRLVALT
eukprot:29726-Pelagococcus_subviridis.AAC.2